MSRARINDLPERYRANVLRQQSRDLGRKNGPTIQPTTTEGGDASCPTSSLTRCPKRPTSTAPQTSDPDAARTLTWWRTASQGSAIVEIEVTDAGKGWLDIVTSTGAIQRTRTDGADSYHPTRPEAVAAVNTRLLDAAARAQAEYAAFLDREYPRE